MKTNFLFCIKIEKSYTKIRQYSFSVYQPMFDLKQEEFDAFFTKRNLKTHNETFHIIFYLNFQNIFRHMYVKIAVSTQLHLKKLHAQLIFLVGCS